MAKKPTKKTAGKQPKTKKGTKKKVLAKSNISLNWIIGGMLALTAICFFPSLQNGFTNWDDLAYVTENRFITRLNVENISAMFSREIASNYHPLTILSLAINYQISNLDAWSYHLFNLIFHLANTGLVFFFMYRLFDKKWQLALVGGLLFGIHPIHVESVAWVAERKDVLYTFFFLLGLLRYLKYRETKDNKDLYITAAWFILSLLSKPTAVIFPVVLAFLDFLEKRNDSARATLEKVPFIVLSIIFGLITYWIQSDTAVGSMDDYTIIQRIQFMCYGTWYYIQQFFIPVNLSTFHPYPRLGDLPMIYKIAPMIVLVIAAGTFLSLKQTRMIFFGMAFYVAGIFLTLQFIQVGSAIVSERYTYLSYIGLSMVILYIVDRYFMLPDGNIHHFMIGGLGIWLVIMGLFTFQQTKVWKNSETLWTQVIQVYPNSAVAYNNLGNYFSDEARNEEAITALNQSIALKPNYPKALNSRGKTYRLLGRQQEALADFNRSIELDPDVGEVYSNRGNVYFDLQRFDLALADYNLALQFDPYNDKAIGNSGSILFQQGQYQQAIEKYTHALQINAAYADAYLNRGASYAVTGQSQAAINDFTAFLKFNQRNWRAWYWRGLEYQKTGQHQQAINDFNQAFQVADRAGQGVIQQAIATSQANLRQ